MTTNEIASALMVIAMGYANLALGYWMRGAMDRQAAREAEKPEGFEEISGEARR